MPIYPHRCPDCSHSHDHLMKVGEPSPPCPKCGSASYARQLTAASFALKGSGFYATDFKAQAPSEPKAGSGSGPCGGSCACHP